MGGGVFCRGRCGSKQWLQCSWWAELWGCSGKLSWSPGRDWESRNNGYRKAFHQRSTTSLPTWPKCFHTCKNSHISITYTVCIYAFIIFLLIRTTRQEEPVDRRYQRYSDYSSNTESTCCYINTHLVLYFPNGSIVYPSWLYIFFCAICSL